MHSAKEVVFGCLKLLGKTRDEWRPARARKFSAWSNLPSHASYKIANAHSVNGAVRVDEILVILRA